MTQIDSFRIDFYTPLSLCLLTYSRCVTLTLKIRLRMLSKTLTRAIKVNFCAYMYLVDESHLMHVLYVEFYYYYDIRQFGIMKKSENCSFRWHYVESDSGIYLLCECAYSLYTLSLRGLVKAVVLKLFHVEDPQIDTYQSAD